MAESTATSPKRTRKRANGEGSLYRDAAGRWRGAVTWTDPSGKHQRRTVSAASQADARRRLDVLRSEMARGLTPAVATTLGEYLTGWLSTGRSSVRPSSWRQREQNVRLYIAPALGRVTLAKLTPADVERMTDGMLARGLSPTTAVGARITLRKALADAQRHELVHRNAAALAKPPRMERAELRYLSLPEMRTLLTACEADPLGPLVTVAATTGLRQGELLGLSWDDVDLAEGRLTVRHALALNASGGYSLAEPKTSRSRRTIHLAGVAVDALRREQAEQAIARARAASAWQDRSNLVFTDAVGRPFRGSGVTHRFAALLASAGLPHIPFHGLRHSAATALLAAGVPLRVVADQLGHSTIAITGDIYASVVPELRRDAADAMDRVMAKQP